MSTLRWTAGTKQKQECNSLQVYQTSVDRAAHSVAMKTERKRCQSHMLVARLHSRRDLSSGWLRGWVGHRLPGRHAAPAVVPQVPRGRLEHREVRQTRTAQIFIRARHKHGCSCRWILDNATRPMSLHRFTSRKLSATYTIPGFVKVSM